MPRTVLRACWKVSLREKCDHVSAGRADDGDHDDDDDDDDDHGDGHDLAERALVYRAPRRLPLRSGDYPLQQMVMED